MCGRAYSTYTEDELEMRYLTERSKRKPFGLKPNYNLSPTQNAPVVFLKDSRPTLALLRWGLVPFWAKDVKSAAKYSLINARGEEILEKRSYKDAFLKRRCIVPLSGFIEWKRSGESKAPFAVHLKAAPIMSIAGIYEHWTDSESGEVVDSFSIVTTSANAFMKKIHDRMPVILAPQDEETWLSPESPQTTILKLLKPCAPKLLVAYPISTAINSPKNNRAELLKPL